ncbi:hypothetical protein [Streptosporangium sp. KLBMP 9127]|nr:hypothetical protein [Streptosporangium sp. KLBMP 9127]
MLTFAYRRDESQSFGELRFPEVETLDVAELARRWSAWIDLSDADPAPLRSLHAVHLARMLTGEDELEAPSWFSTVSVTSSRYQVVAQARAHEHQCGRPEQLPEHLRTPRWRALVRFLDHWQELPVPDRIVVVMLLTQLGFHRHVVGLLPTLFPSGDPLRQHLAYEAGRAAFQLNRKSPVPAKIFAWLAEHAVRPALRTLAALQLVSAKSRDTRDPTAAGRWLGVAGKAADDLHAEPAWLAHLVRSRHHRAAALHELSGGDHETVVGHMREALRHDDALAGLVDDPVRTHYQRENRGLVLEAHLKLDTLTGKASAPADAVEQLLTLDPVDPEPLYAIGHYLAARDDWEAAHGVFWQAAGSGTLRGAMAANAAAVCAEQLGRPDDAARARLLCRDLDPATH